MVICQEGVWGLSKVFVFNGSVFKMSFLVYYLVHYLLYLIPIVFMIIFSLSLCVLFRGNAFGVVLCSTIYVLGLSVSNILISNGVNVIKYGFMQYMDFTYFENVSNVVLSNAIFNTNYGYFSALLCFGVYSVLFVLLSVILLKRDV